MVCSLAKGEAGRILVYWQQELLKPFIKVNPNIVLVLNNGRPLAIPWLLKIFPQLSKVAFRNAKWQWLKFVW
jgi:hypothetical protein